MMPNCTNSWVLRKRGYFYRPNAKGYTGSVMEAGLYTEEEAKSHAQCEGVTAHRVTEFTEIPLQQFPDASLTPSSVHIYREATGASMMDAKKVLSRADFNSRFWKFRETSTIEEKVEFILDWIEKQENK